MNVLDSMRCLQLIFDLIRSMEIIIALVLLFSPILVASLWALIMPYVFLKKSYDNDVENGVFRGSFSNYRETRKFRFARGTYLQYYKLQKLEAVIVYGPFVVVFALFLVISH